MEGRFLSGPTWPTDAFGDLTPVEMQADRYGNGVPQRVVNIAVSFSLCGQRLQCVVGGFSGQVDVVDQVGEPAVYAVVDVPAQGSADGPDSEITCQQEFDYLVEQTGERAGQEKLQRRRSGVRAAALAGFVDDQPVVRVWMWRDLIPQLLHLRGIDADGADAPAAAAEQMIDRDLDELGSCFHRACLP